MSEKAKRVAAAARVLQVTDTHLFADPAEVLVGMNCEEGLHDVLQLIRGQEQDIAAFVCTGDISQDHSASSYRRFEQAIAAFKVPQYWIPGNHDELSRMQAAVGADHPCFTRSFSVPGWRVIMLNSSVRGEVYGRLAAEELRELDQHLAQADEAHIMVCLHHNPVPVAAHWLQQHALKNPKALFAVLDTYPQVRLVLFGHIHQDLSHQRAGVLYLGAPSTCIQFHPSSFDFALDHLNPGYRWFDLYPDGRFETGVRRVENKRYAVDFSGIGY